MAADAAGSVESSMQGPLCENCRRRGENCDLVWRFADATSFRIYSVACPSRWNDLGLLSYFADVTSTYLALVECKAWFWTVEVPRMAENMPFLLHGVSALSALHIAENQSNYSSALSLSRKHFITASCQFRLMVNQIDTENCVAIFAFVLIVSMIQFKCSCAPSRLGLLSNYFDPMNVIGALRGAAYLSKTLVPFVDKQSSFSTLFVQQTAPSSEQTKLAVKVITDQLNELSSMPLDADNKAAATHLRFWIAGLGARPKGWLQLSWWPASVSPGYLSKLQQSDPVALLLYTYWCLGLHSEYIEWFLNEYAQQATRFVYSRLDSHYANMLDKTLQELQIVI
ncbi:uncharacterized protein TRUGW13939_08740 [Talaromyces rugulosus]|uniref:Zn(2)-C6 fungal-type domain-containing protein n=1 Tax=Talaromyces rugulosus TaxID=121627 RepID=A0A7H8R6L0_TALRU|nr:uncharacterized protein TRUGW13939_08740 [Talaromyces rugulosus]QKX61588.1 hypothetical protein TRUGW13939_08740 [Talaromyces rugulosus]